MKDELLYIFDILIILENYQYIVMEALTKYKLYRKAMEFLIEKGIVKIKRGNKKHIVYLTEKGKELSKQLIYLLEMLMNILG